MTEELRKPAAPAAPAAPANPDVIQLSFAESIGARVHLGERST